MSRLFDRLMLDGYGAQQVDAIIYQAMGAMEALEHATVIVADNVEKYWEAEYHMPSLPELEEAFPKIVSPLTPAFYEAIPTPGSVFSESVTAFGMLCRSHDLKTDAGREILGSPVYQARNFGLSFVDVDDCGVGDIPLNLSIEELYGDTRWIMECWVFYEPRPGGPLSVGGSKKPWLVGVYMFPAKESGAPIATGHHPLRRSVCFAHQVEEASEIAAALTAGLRFVFPFMLTISFMHCKNLQTKEVGPSTWDNRLWVKKHKKKLVRYYVLDIEPMGEVLEAEGGVSGVGLPKALHICRGHFATYTEDAPLFGRVIGTFWKPQHIRGKVKHGVVNKDYRVHPPKGG